MNAPEVQGLALLVVFVLGIVVGVRIATPPRRPGLELPPPRPRRPN